MIRLSNEVMDLSLLSVGETSVHEFRHKHKHHGPTQPWMDDRPMATLASFLGLGRLAKSLLSRTIRRTMHTSIRGRTIALVMSCEGIRCSACRKYANNASTGEEMD